MYLSLFAFGLFLSPLKAPVLDKLGCVSRLGIRTFSRSLHTWPLTPQGKVPHVGWGVQVQEPLSFMPFSSLGLGPRRSFTSCPRVCFEDEDDGVLIANPCLDRYFHYGFEDPNVLKAFLNAVLPLSESKKITEVVHLPREVLPADMNDPAAKHFTSYLRAQTADGEHILVEMQNDLYRGYLEKFLAEHCAMNALVHRRMPEDQQRTKKKRSELWRHLSGVYSVLITNKFMRGKQKKKWFEDEQLAEPIFWNVYELRHTTYLDRHYGELPFTLIVLALDHLPSDPRALRTDAEKWGWVFKDERMRSGKGRVYADKYLENVNNVIGPQDPWLGKFVQKLRADRIPSDEVNYMHKVVDHYNRTLDEREEKGRKEGEEKGRKEGEEKGRKEGLIDMAKRMLAAHESIEKIQDYTKLSKRQLQDLKNQQTV